MIKIKRMPLWYRAACKATIEKHKRVIGLSSYKYNRFIVYTFNKKLSTTMIKGKSIYFTETIINPQIMRIKDHSSIYVTSDQIKLCEGYDTYVNGRVSLFIPRHNLKLIKIKYSEYII